MTAPDPLDVARARLVGHVEPGLLDSAIADVRKQFGGGNAYIHSLCQVRADEIRRALDSGLTIAQVAKRFHMTTQAIGYWKRKKLSADQCS